jgi:16S rRNA (uracil1498-N3)-methyltransferase
VRAYRCLHEGQLLPGAEIVLGEEESRHLAAARRAAPGDPVLILNGAGAEFAAVITAIGKRTTTVRLAEPLRHEPAPPRPIALGWSPTKSPDFDGLFQRAVELGMTDFHVIAADRCVVDWSGDRWEKKADRLTRLAGEALKQCERLWLPRLQPPRPLAALLADPRPWTPIFLEERRPDAPPLATVLHGVERPLLLVGPEGGWSDAEKAVARGAAARPASLGTAILRAETALIAALAVAALASD